MPLPVNKNLSIYQGDTYSFKFRLRTKDSEGTIEPIDLTGATVRADIKSKDLQQVLVPFTAQVTSALGGEVQLSLTNEQTSDLEENGKWDCQVTFPEGTVRTYLKGSVSLKSQVTT